MNRWLDSGPAPQYINQYWICEKCQQAMRRVWTVRGYWSEWFHLTLSNTWACQRWWEKPKQSREAGEMNAEEAARGWSDSTPQAEQAEKLDATSAIGAEKAVVEEVGESDSIPYWRRPHSRIVTGPLTGDRP